MGRDPILNQVDREVKITMEGRPEGGEEARHGEIWGRGFNFLEAEGVGTFKEHRRCRKRSRWGPRS